MKRSAVRIVLLVTLIGLSVILIFSLISPFWVLAYSDSILKNELDNQYINSNYSDWKPVTLSADYSFLVPEQWKFQYCSDSYYFSSELENLDVYCAIIGSENKAFISTQEYISTLTDFNIISVEQTYFPETISVGMSDFCKLTVHGEESSVDFYRLKLQDTDTTKCVFLFPIDAETDHEKIIELSEAIMYSYVFDCDQSQDDKRQT